MGLVLGMKIHIVNEILQFYNYLPSKTDSPSFEQTTRVPFTQTIVPSLIEIG